MGYYWDGFRISPGGAAGNFDRQDLPRYVTDIFLVNLFPVFNLADLSIFLAQCLLSSVNSEPVHSEGFQPISLTMNVAQGEIIGG